MAREKSGPISAILSIAQKKEAMVKLERRLDDLRQLDISSQSETAGPEVKQIQQRLAAFLTDTFGVGTIEFNRYSPTCTRLFIGVLRSRGLTDQEIREGLEKGKSAAIACLEGIKADFEESISDANQGIGGANSALKAYEGLSLHPEIEKACGKLFRDGHYSEAIEKGMKKLNAYVRFKSGVEKDGSQLMESVFSAKNPVLKFNDMADDSDRDEQVGFLMMFKGAVAGLRNPRAHRIMNDDPERALEFIAFISLLAKLLDEAEAA